ncbi:MULTISPECIES: low molecular weight protein-tyrosine-phosphatase [Burkholderia]|uniref:low molecular weight protein-tyrosine-phosphatase n=1 Tax=Burkholderia TaxID=32008 RepID=UPI00068DE40B|nr:MULTISPECIES: low molecular weight protein-tyrosine-phosphatase [Burkholderia]MBR7911881.1 low molecular weight phosphotyrosine protein phosphatase [Burkholderia vietnamiensis]MBR8229182.1 low molecular weight phosphotyrosine protein phosphatase [Burkholderia vietnamiensis]MCA7987149.1 low molecular weight phosphotyrosine protein phosphatase [Burkholderia vietnamiensis]HDR8933750.1 low molecular weight phosphotyrosine protein phosphatase [Burkholderia vietnamiensis]HDR9277119.1 low molecula
MIRSILVVCIGNICRSPMAEAMLASALPGCIVQSAGVGALVGAQADPIARELMREKGFDIECHRARQLLRSHCMHADLVLVMDTEQKRHVERLNPLSRGRVFRMGEFGDVDIRDPFRGGRDAFVSALGSIERGVSEWSKRIASSGPRTMEAESQQALAQLEVRGDR